MVSAPAGDLGSRSPARSGPERAAAGRQDPEPWGGPQGSELTPGSRPAAVPGHKRNGPDRHRRPGPRPSALSCARASGSRPSSRQRYPARLRSTTTTGAAWPARVGSCAGGQCRTRSSGRHVRPPPRRASASSPEARSGWLPSGPTARHDSEVARPAREPGRLSIEDPRDPRGRQALHCHPQRCGRPLTGRPVRRSQPQAGRCALDCRHRVSAGFRRRACSPLARRTRAVRVDPRSVASGPCGLGV